MFEYKIVLFEREQPAEDMESGLNIYGVEGWELVTIESYSKSGLTQLVFQASTTSGFVAIFKRRKEQANG